MNNSAAGEGPVLSEGLGRKPAPQRSVLCFATGGEARGMLRAFTDDIRFVMQDGSPAEVYYRIEEDGTGVLVCKPASDPQVFCEATNSGLFAAR